MHLLNLPLMCKSLRIVQSHPVAAKDLLNLPLMYKNVRIVQKTIQLRLEATRFPHFSLIRAMEGKKGGGRP